MKKIHIGYWSAILGGGLTLIVLNMGVLIPTPVWFWPVGIAMVFTAILLGFYGKVDLANKDKGCQITVGLPHKK